MPGSQDAMANGCHLAGATSTDADDLEGRPDNSRMVQQRTAQPPLGQSIERATFNHHANHLDHIE